MVIYNDFTEREFFHSLVFGLLFGLCRSSALKYISNTTLKCNGRFMISQRVSGWTHRQRLASGCLSIRRGRKTTTEEEIPARQKQALKRLRPNGVEIFFLSLAWYSTYSSIHYCYIKRNKSKFMIWIHQLVIVLIMCLPQQNLESRVISRQYSQSAKFSAVVRQGRRCII